MKRKILVVDDEESMCEFMSIMLNKEGYHVRTTTSSMEALKIIGQEDFDLVISDVVMPEIDGVQLLEKIKKTNPETEIIMITAYASLDSAVNALREGAVDYITKPFRVDEIKHAINKVLESKELKSENLVLKKQLKKQNAMDAMVGNDPKMVEIKAMINAIAPTDSSVLITGESGTGKELVARAIHQLSQRSEGPFITINCGAIPENLLESEMFGHKKGAFTGAINDKDGLFKVADNGTLLLDEVGEIPLNIQVKLLRAIEEKEITPIGEVKPLKVNTRLIAATNADLKDLCEKGLFREDLYYRLNVFPIHIPPLRQRKDDIPLILDHILERYARELNMPRKKISESNLETLKKARWKGNVRELENIIERALVLCKGKYITEDYLPDYLFEEQEMPLPLDEQEDLSPNLENIERAYIYWVLKRTGWNKTKTADILGINASTLYRKIIKYNLKEEN